MKRHDKTGTIVGILAAERDRLNFEAKNIRDRATARLKQVKAETHDDFIEANQLEKKAQLIQSCITLEMEQVYQEEQQLNSEWEYKGTSQLQAQIVDSEYKHNI